MWMTPISRRGGAPGGPFVVWALVFFFFVSGCGYREFGLPTNTGPDPEMPAVKVGQNVKILTVEGKKFEGEVVSVSVDEIVIGRPSNYGFEKLVFGAGDIAEIKAEKLSPITTGVILGAAILLVLFGYGLSQIDLGSN